MRIEEESVDHLFVHCKWVSSLWALALFMMGISWIQSSHVKDVLVSWRRRLKKCWVHGIWKLIPIAIWWCTWKERNRRIFDDKALSFQDFKLYFLGTLYSWSQVLVGGSTVSLLDFVDKIMFESLQALWFLYLPLLYMGVTPLVSLLYNSCNYLSKKKYISNGKESDITNAFVGFLSLFLFSLCFQ